MNADIRTREWMKLVTVATRSDGYFPYLMMSCKRHNIKLDVLGWGEPWQGWMWRMRLVREYLESCRDDEPVCFIDAYDVIVLQPLHVLEQKFEKMVPSKQECIVVAQDIAQPSMIEAIAVVMFGRCKGLRINAGTYVGRAAAIRGLLDAMCSDGACNNIKADDQVLLTKLCAATPGALIIDTDQELFLTVANHRRNLDFEACGIEIRDDHVLRLKRKNKADTFPCILHAPATTRMDTVLAKLDYPIFTERNLAVSRIRQVFETSIVLLAFVSIVIIASSRYGMLCACPTRRR